jgi:hypothetical protein
MRSNKFLIRLSWLLSFIFVIITSCNDSKNNVETKTVSDTLKSTEVANPYVSRDQSPMDMSYYPADYPVSRMNGTDSAALLARVIYSRPQKKGRLIFGASPKCLREYGKEWRLGANEATEIEFFKDVIINGQKITKGRYVIYCIPFEQKWTIILNTNLFAWGLHMDKSKDIFAVDIPTELQAPALEDFTMIFEKASYGADLIIAWDHVKVMLRIRTTS